MGKVTQKDKGMIGCSGESVTHLSSPFEFSGFRNETQMVRDSLLMAEQDPITTKYRTSDKLLEA